MVSLIESGIQINHNEVGSFKEGLNNVVTIIRISFLIIVIVLSVHMHVNCNLLQGLVVQID